MRIRTLVRSLHFAFLGELLNAEMHSTEVYTCSGVYGSGGLGRGPGTQIIFREGSYLTLVGVDDVPSARMTIPALTTLRQPIPAMVQIAFEQLITTGEKSQRTILVKPELVIRESSAAKTENGNG